MEDKDAFICIVNIMAADGLARKGQGISSHDIDLVVLEYSSFSI